MQVVLWRIITGAHRARVVFPFALGTARIVLTVSTVCAMTSGVLLIGARVRTVYGIRLVLAAAVSTDILTPTRGIWVWHLTAVIFVPIHRQHVSLGNSVFPMGRTEGHVSFVHQDDFLILL